MGALMICSVELPVPYLEYSTCFDYDFVIASIWIVNEEYRDYYLYKRSKRFTILDNGAFEIGHAIDDDQYIKIAAELHPDIIICPDVFKNQPATGSRAIAFIDKWLDNLIPGIDLMGVLQGNSRRSLISMYNTLYKQHCKYIGLPYATEIDRFQFLKAHPEIENVHILGLPNLAEALALCTLPNVVSIDSSLPVKITKDEMLLEDKFYSDSYVDIQDHSLTTSLLQHNLEIFSAVCNRKTKIVRR